MTVEKVQIEIGGKTLDIETGRMAKQADGSALVRYADTMVLVAAVASKDESADRGFFPLSVDYREKKYAAGKVPGGFFKREGRPSEKEVLSSRQIDRPIRPLFPPTFMFEVQVTASVLSSDQENDSDTLALIGASTALSISDIPFDGPIGALRIGRIDGNLILNPTFSQLEERDINLVVAASTDSIIMVEGGLREISEDELLEALLYAHEHIKPIIQLQRELMERIGRPKRPVPEPVVNTELENRVREITEAALKEANRMTVKEERQERIRTITKDAVEQLSEEFPESERQIKRQIHDIERDDVRQLILDEGKRADGREPADIREVTCEVGVLPRTHGSALFTRGQTQSLVVTTLGTKVDEQKVDDLEGESWKSYMLHYNFPPFSVGEVRPMRGPGRREIGHGALAERSIQPVIPSEETFPYTLRIVSDVLESNGSSSMATVCGASLALMDAGVQIKAPVAGIAMGLISDEERTVILTDISGLEDHLGDMDFKITGTREGITGLQMDIKMAGLNADIMRESLYRAKNARLHILDIMNQTMAQPRSDLSPYAPRILTLKINPDKIREVIGPGGKMIRKITEETKTSIDINDDGTITIASPDMDACEQAVEIIKNLTQDVEIGQIYEGTVRRVTGFGAFVELLPSQEGLVHISQLEHSRVNRVEDVCRVGDKMRVKVIGIDEQGKISISRKALLEGGPPEGYNDRDRGGDRGGRRGPRRPDSSYDRQR
jgi:polyribonucleotide nucleotidyltransferase